MTARHVYVIECDAPGCAAQWTGEPVWYELAATGRREAAEAGWRHVTVKVTKNGPAPSVDLCPGCADVDPVEIVKARWAAVRGDERARERRS